MDRPINNTDKGQLTDEEFRILKAADEKMKGGKPTREGWWRFKENGYGWFPVKVIRSKKRDCLAFNSIFASSMWFYVPDTTDDQWAGEIEMPK